MKYETPRPGMVRAVKVDGTVGWADITDNPQLMIVDELPFYEQPSLSLEEMEKAWGEELVVIQPMLSNRKTLRMPKPRHKVLSSR